MPALLCTLGSSWAVVPEAFLLGNGPAFYDRVLVLTSSGTSSSVEQCHAWFAQHHPRVALTILAVEDLPDLATAEDHHRFEEALYRCYFSLLADATHEEIHVCLAGGFKTMSAAAQEAAGLLGCTKLFHITSPLGVRIGTHEEILAAIADHSIRLIDLGSRSGWPTMRELASETLPAPSASGRISVGEATPLRNAIHNRLEAANRLAASEKDLATLPFPQIARWAPSERAWLNEPLDPSIDGAWLLALPKVELHCHLGGFATHGRLLDQVRAAACDPAKLPVIKTLSPPAGWPATVLSDEPKQRLAAYMQMGDNNGSKLLRDPGCLAEHCRLLFQHLVSQNIVYAEIRCSPANYASEGCSPWTVLSEIKSTFDACMTDQPGCHVNLIIIATRKDQGDYRTDIARHLSLAVTAAEHWLNDPGCRVVGVDLAGYEDTSTRAHYFREDFSAAHRIGLGITIHAGENDDAEGIWSAILDINTRRLGHALHLADSPTLLKTVADRRIGIEMCPYANLQIKGFPLDSRSVGILPTSLPNYPLLDYLQAGIPVTVNTDNIGISAASLTENFLLLPRLCPGITRLHVLELLRNSIDQAFLTGPEKNRLLALPIPHHRSA
jgi:adenosine deaminase